MTLSQRKLLPVLPVTLTVRNGTGANAGEARAGLSDLSDPLILPAVRAARMTQAERAVLVIHTLRRRASVAVLRVVVSRAGRYFNAGCAACFEADITLNARAFPVLATCAETVAHTDFSTGVIRFKACLRRITAVRLALQVFTRTPLVHLHAGVIGSVVFAGSDRVASGFPNGDVAPQLVYGSSRSFGITVLALVVRAGTLRTGCTYRSGAREFLVAFEYAFAILQFVAAVARFLGARRGVARRAFSVANRVEAGAALTTAVLQRVTVVARFRGARRGTARRACSVRDRMERRTRFACAVFCRVRAAAGRAFIFRTATGGAVTVDILASFA